MSTVKIIAWLLGGAAVLAVLVFLSIFYKMAFIAEITERKLKKGLVVRPLIDGIEIAELAVKSEALPYDHQPSTGDLPSAVPMLLAEDGTLTEGRAVFDAEVEREYDVLISADYCYAFKGNKIFRCSANRLGDMVEAYDHSQLDLFRHAAYVNPSWLLIIGDKAGVTPAESHLWQLNLETFAITHIADSPYYAFDRPPKTFTPAAFPGVVVVYYTGSLDFGFGGDSSRPEFSVIRIYTAEHPEGLDIAEFGLNGGTIVDVSFNEGKLVLTGDPSRPLAADKPRLPARVWEVSFNVPI